MNGLHREAARWVWQSRSPSGDDFQPFGQASLSKDLAFGWVADAARGCRRPSNAAFTAFFMLIAQNAPHPNWGMVSVIIYLGTSASVSKHVIHLLLATGLVKFHQLDRGAVIKFGYWRVIKGYMTIDPDS